MLIYDIGQSSFQKGNNNSGSKLFQLPIKKLKIQSRNINLNNNLSKEINLKKNSLYSTKEATPRKEYNHVLNQSCIKKNICPSKEITTKNDLDDSLSQISQILNSSKKNLNYSGLIPGINEETNFVYDQILFNKSRINKAKILSHKIGVLKLPISKISSKEALSNSDREKKCFSDRIQVTGNNNGNKNKSNNIQNNADISCCFFGGK
jgi:hypothetical protein